MDLVLRRYKLTDAEIVMDLVLRRYKLIPLLKLPQMRHYAYRKTEAD